MSGGGALRTSRLLERALLRMPRRIRRPVGRRIWPRECPICREPAPIFRTFGTPPRPDAQCPRCGALERHRLLWLFLDRRMRLLHPPRRRVLHMAPERQIGPRLRRLPHLEMVSADLEADLSVALRLDLTAAPFPDRTFDVVLCSHVLEHVPDDRRAMREIRRILRPGGWAILQVPIRGDATDEDPSVTDPEERLRRFGQRDHVRQYGRDYPDRLREEGFRVDVVRYTSELTPEEIERFGLRHHRIHLCRRADAEDGVPDRAEAARF